MIDRLKQGDKVPFTQISNKMLNDPELPCKAKGMLAYMLSKPDGWNFNVKGMASQLKENKDTISSILMILRAHRYVERRELRAKGSFAGYEYVVYQAPCPKTSDTVSSDPVFSDISNTGLSNKDLRKKKNSLSSSEGPSRREADTEQASEEPEYESLPEDKSHDVRQPHALLTNRSAKRLTRGLCKASDLLDDVMKDLGA